MIHSRWLSPLKTGIILGLAAGCCIGAVLISRHDYIGYHLYNTAANIIAANINRMVLQITAVLYLFWLVFMAGMLFKGSARRTFRIVGYVLAIIITVRVVEHVYFVSEWLFVRANNGQSWAWPSFHFVVLVRDITSKSAMRIFMHECGWMILLALSVLLGGLVLLRRLRVKSPMESHARDMGEGRKPEPVKSAPKLRIVPPVFVVCFAIFIGANFTAGLLRYWGRTNAADKPNIIIIAVDTLRADHLGCYGYFRNTSPNIDRLAQTGIRFDRAYSQAPWTTASFGSMLTSRYPQSYDTGTVDHPNRLDDRLLTMTEALKDQGYTTGAVISNPYFASRFNTHQGFDFFEETHGVHSITSPGVLTQAKTMISRMKDGKFFLFLLFLDPHSAYVRHDDYKFMQDLPKIVGLSLEDSVRCRFSKRQIEQLKALYDSEIAFTDRHIGLLIDELKKQKLYDDSVVILLSDHGEEFADHGAFYHGHSLYNELLHVPLIVKLPRQEQGRVAQGAFPLANVFPSVARLIDCDTTAFRLQGKAVDLTNITDLPDEDILAATRITEPWLSLSLQSLQSSGHKYILDVGTRKGKLFDLMKDQAEQHNIADSRPDITASIRKALHIKVGALQAGKAAAVSAEPMPKLNEEEKARLRSLGYLAQ